MIYPIGFEQKMGFDSIRLLLKENCLSTLGQDLVDLIAFSSQIDDIDRCLRLTREFMQVIDSKVLFPNSHYIDMRNAIDQLHIEGLYWNEQELFSLQKSLETIFLVINFLSQREGVNNTLLYPTLHSLTSEVIDFKIIRRRLDTILSPYGKIKDNASPQLAEIRKELASTIQSISKTLHSILKSAQAEGYVEKDVAPSMRDGRLVIPVIPAHKRKVKGIVHDESATGKTLYIEPTQVVEANNQIRELENQERREIIRILTEFTNYIRPHADDLRAAYHLLSQVDFIRAKALFSLDIGAIVPTLTTHRIIDWRCATHPLLYRSLRKQGKSAIPLDLTLQNDNRILLISGPNAGGKSVCLKTVGLLQYMVQCGLPIPVGSDSTVGIFDDIMVDIGDEQSIENDLSTYSSHLLNMKNFLRQASAHSLILIDEFGTGTEPQIGGAIAQAVLQRLNQAGSWGVITTHYQNLKQFAEDNIGIINGAMLYDRHLMQPLFQLQIGNPGSSFAIEIARKIGLPEQVIADASESVGETYVNMDKFLQDIVRDKRYWEQKRQQIRLKEKKLEELSAHYEQELAKSAQERKEIIRQAKTEAQMLIKESNARIEKTIREIKEAQAERQQTQLIRKQMTEFKQEILSLEEGNRDIASKMERLRAKQQRKQEARNSASTAPSEPSATKPVTPKSHHATIQVGATVRLKGQTAVGEVLSLQGSTVQVAFGQLKSQLKLSQLEVVSATKAAVSKRKIGFISGDTADQMHDKKLHFKHDIDLRGLRTEEALTAVTYYIDDAIQVGVERVRLLHGTGTGALKRAIAEYLKTVPGVTNFREEHIQFGGAGVTIVEF